MSAWTQEDVDRLNAKRGASLPAHVPVKSKYRNVKTLAAGFIFDSKREANHWLILKAREGLGEITELRRQVRFPLYTTEVVRIKDSDHIGQIALVQVAEYIADFTYISGNGLNVVDAKGKRTQMYALKKKWLELQSGIIIEEV